MTRTPSPAPRDPSPWIVPASFDAIPTLVISSPTTQEVAP
jgi:hypothetical protein